MVGIGLEHTIDEERRDVQVFPLQRMERFAQDRATDAAEAEVTWNPDSGPLRHWVWTSMLSPTGTTEGLWRNRSTTYAPQQCPLCGKWAKVSVRQALYVRDGKPIWGTVMLNKWPSWRFYCGGKTRYMPTAFHRYKELDTAFRTITRSVMMARFVTAVLLEGEEDPLNHYRELLWPSEKERICYRTRDPRYPLRVLKCVEYTEKDSVARVEKDKIPYRLGWGPSGRERDSAEYIWTTLHDRRAALSNSRRGYVPPQVPKPWEVAKFEFACGGCTKNHKKGGQVHLGGIDLIKPPGPVGIAKELELIEKEIAARMTNTSDG